MKVNDKNVEKVVKDVLAIKGFILTYRCYNGIYVIRGINFKKLVNRVHKFYFDNDVRVLKTIIKSFKYDIMRMNEFAENNNVFALDEAFPRVLNKESLIKMLKKEEIIGYYVNYKK